MSQELTLDFTENIFYSTSVPVSIKEVIASLQGWETVIKQSQNVLKELTQADILDITVHVERLEAGSLYEDIVIKLLFGNQQELDKFLESIHQKIGDGKLRNTLISAVIASLVAYGLVLASQAMSPDTTTHFEANNNTIINIGAGEANISPERLQSIIETTVPNKKALAKGAVKTLQPARNDENSTMSIGVGSSTVTIPSETIRQAPTDVSFDAESYTRDHSDVNIEIRALDLDSPDKGWAAVIPGLIDRRVKLVLAPGIDTNTLSGKFAFRADVTITYKLTGKDNQYKPVEIFIKDIIE